MCQAPWLFLWHCRSLQWLWPSAFWQLSAASLPTLWQSILSSSQPRKEPLLNFFVMLMPPYWYIPEGLGEWCVIWAFVWNMVLNSPAFWNMFIPACLFCLTSLFLLLPSFREAQAFLLYWELLLFFPGFLVNSNRKFNPFSEFLVKLLKPVFEWLPVKEFLFIYSNIPAPLSSTLKI